METDLKAFVKQVLLDITEAVQEAKDAAPVAIAPGTVDKKSKIEPQLVHFDISVTASTNKAQNKNMSGKATIVTVLRADATTGEKSEDRTSETNRIKFSVPVYFQAYLPRHEQFKK